MITLILISLAAFIAYTALVIKAYGIPVSVSDTFYLLPPKRRWLFTAFCLTVGAPLLPAWIVLAGENLQFLPFLSCAGLLFVGAAAQFKAELVGNVHYVAAGICLVASLLWIILDTPLWWLAALIYATAGVMAWRERRNWLFWVEIAAFVSVYAVVLIEYASHVSGM